MNKKIDLPIIASLAGKLGFAAYIAPSGSVYYTRLDKPRAKPKLETLVEVCHYNDDIYRYRYLNWGPHEMRLVTRARLISFMTNENWVYYAANKKEAIKKYESTNSIRSSPKLRTGSKTTKRRRGLDKP